MPGTATGPDSDGLPPVAIAFVAVAIVIFIVVLLIIAAVVAKMKSRRNNPYLPVNSQLPDNRQGTISEIKHESMRFSPTDEDQDIGGEPYEPNHSPDRSSETVNEVSAASCKANTPAPTSRLSNSSTNELYGSRPSVNTLTQLGIINKVSSKWRDLGRHLGQSTAYMRNKQCLTTIPVVRECLTTGSTMAGISPGIR